MRLKRNPFAMAAIASSFVVASLVTASASVQADAATRPVVSSTSTTSTASCPVDNVFFIGVAGSGELPSTNDANMGAKIYPVWETVQKKFGLSQWAGQGMTTATSAYGATSTYKADSVSDLIPDKLSDLTDFLTNGGSAKSAYITANLDPYVQSITNGTLAIDDTISADLAKCPSAKFILAGYSQGAMAIRDYEDAPKGVVIKNKTVAVTILATLLVGDGYREQPMPDYANVGTAEFAANTPMGGIAEVTKFIPFITQPGNDAYQPTTVELCNKDDIVCDFQEMKAGKLITLMGRIKNGVNVHLYSYVNQQGKPTASMNTAIGDVTSLVNQYVATLKKK